MKNCVSVIVLSLWAFQAIVAAGPGATPPVALRFDELVALSRNDALDQALENKLKAVLDSTTVENGGDNPPHRPLVPGLGPVLRVAAWNIDHGLNYDQIRMALSGADDLLRSASGPSIESQLRVLRDADVILLSEVDLGVKRTDYRDIAKELAHALGMNYAFGVEFVEVDRLEDLGLEPVTLDDPALTRQLNDQLRPDPARYRGLEGNVILSRYPIRNARTVRLPVCHDWFETELAATSALEKGKRLAANKLFLARIEREVRRGGRMALIADLTIPGLPGETATVVSVHLENKCMPACRAKQMDALLAAIRDVDHPLILGGDLNTTGADGTPTSIRRELMQRVKNYEFWATQAIKWGTPAGLPLLASTPVAYFRSYKDPTSFHVPVISGNKEAKLFRKLEGFRFADGRAFDFRGDSDRNLHDRSRTLANSNQRAGKGFEPTFTLKREFGGLVGRYKLDWMFVSPYITEPRRADMSYRFAPHHPLTMRDLNNAIEDGISDHAPITVDLPFEEPE